MENIRWWYDSRKQIQPPAASQYTKLRHFHVRGYSEWSPGFVLYMPEKGRYAWWWQGAAGWISGNSLFLPGNTLLAIKNSRKNRRSALPKACCWWKSLYHLHPSMPESSTRISVVASRSVGLNALHAVNNNENNSTPIKTRVFSERKNDPEFCLEFFRSGFPLMRKDTFN